MHKTIKEKKHGFHNTFNTSKSNKLYETYMKHYKTPRLTASCWTIWAINSAMTSCPGSWFTF